MLLLSPHSFVDLITNSSSVVYISAHKSSIDTLHELVDSILAIDKSSLKSRDLFIIEIEPPVREIEDAILRPERYYYIDILDYISNELGEDFKKFLIREVQDKGKLSSKTIEKLKTFDWGWKDEEHGYHFSTVLRVTPKNSSSKAAAALLSNLSSLFAVNARYEG